MNDLEEMGVAVYEMAQEIFIKCHAKDDFCHQTGLVFGGTNRITLTKRGWEADQGLCTLDFYSRFLNLKSQGEL